MSSLKTCSSGPQATSCEQLAYVILCSPGKEKVKNDAATAILPWRASYCDNTL